MSRRVEIVFLCVALLYAVFEAVTTNAFDFRAFYCAGAAVAQGADPYLTKSLHTCEMNRTDDAYKEFSRAVTLPAPLPGYDLALFVPLSRVPFAVAKIVWNAVLLLAIAAALWALTRLGRVAAAGVFAVMWLSLVLPSLEYGEVIPIAVAGIALASLFAGSGQWRAAAICAIVALCEPHLGLPVCAALFALAPATRLWIAGGLAALAALSIATIGVPQNLEYFQTVLPLHALSEIGSDAQLSLSVALYYAGLSGMAAVRAGTIAYALLALIGIPVAGVLASRHKDGAFIVALPAALALAGGSFMHVTDLPAALPLAFLLYRRLQPYRATVVIAIVLLAIPWWHLALLLHQHMYGMAPIAAVVAFYVAWELLEHRAMAALAVGVLACVMLVGINYWYVRSSEQYHRNAPPVRITIDRRYPEASWGWSNARFISTGLPASWALRIPSWTGLLLVIGSGVLAVRRSAMRMEPRAAGPAVSV